MRPLRLLLDGFGSYREPAEADFSDVDFFALVGPTGAGKSTVIDGLCFALYGTVPRWGKENVIAQALAPAANLCRVCLVFESAGKRYGVVRELMRNSRGVVHTKAARLELLDRSIPADAPLADMLGASVEALAEGPEQVKAGVQEILGLSYDHFTQSVLLPQGRFSEFLQAEPRKRQDLLVELLAFGVYEKVGQAARRRADLAAVSTQNAERMLADLAGATQEAETAAAARVADLAALATTVDERLESLKELRLRATELADENRQVTQAAALLAAVRMPADVPGLARSLSEADDNVARCRDERDAADAAETSAQQRRNELPDKTRMDMVAAAYAEHGELSTRLERAEREYVKRQGDEAASAAEADEADKNLKLAHDARRAAERAHAAVALAEQLQVGEECPVCLRPVTALPHHQAPADLAETTAAIVGAEQRLSKARATAKEAAGHAVDAAKAVAGTTARLDAVAATLAQAPAEADVATAISAIAESDRALELARKAAAERRAALAASERERAALSAGEAKARARLAGARDSVVPLGAPALDNADLAASWESLAAWALAEHEKRTERLAWLATAAGSARQKVADAETALAELLAGHGISEADDLSRAAAVVEKHRERAAGRLAAVREDRARAAALDRQIRAHREEQQVATMLGQLLRASSFERWLCGEALDSLVIEASKTLMELSGDQYQLDRNERNELFVIDYQDAGAKRPVSTLSGGETFQASLALALALSRQVIELSAGLRDLNSMFLDEGFGSLDADTLETVGTTLERLAADSDRMIGIITHVPALAERVPVRFVVTRTGITSTLRKERE
jgi:DNA repair protein SbcC/Rad50